MNDPIQMPMYIINIKFPYYPAKVNAMQPLGLISLQDFLLLHLEDNKIFNLIAEAESIGDIKLKASLKQNNLKVFTPCVIIGKGDNGKPWKDYDHIERFTGIAVLDFDHLPDTTTSEQFKQFIYEEYESIITTWLSPSKHGIKALISIPIVNTVNEFKSYFWGLENEFKQYGHITGKPWFDSSGQNPTLSLFQSYDPDLLLARTFTKWTIKGTKPTAFKYDTPTIKPPKITVSDKNRKTVLKIITSMFQNIDSATGGHPSLIKKCITIGGYVSSGYLTLSEAEQLIDWNIENHHYLKKGISGYKKDARFGLSEGLKKPLAL